MAGAEAPRLVVPVGETDHALGVPTAQCTLVEYGDFQCPYCGRAFPILQQLRAEFGDQLRLVFRHFPLFDIHPRAENAAEAAEGAGAQGRFWDMHDLLFQNQRSLEYNDLIGYAGALTLDRQRFEAELLERRYISAVRRSREGGIQGGVNRTPTFFINGEYFGGAHELTALREAIGALLG